MRAIATLAVAALVGNSTWAFAPSSPLLRPTARALTSKVRMGYVPDGLTAADWKKMREEEKAKASNLGRVGVVRFKSRSFQAWQESGAGHLFPVDPKKVKSGEIPMDKVPYMQRGGAWDDSDLANKKFGKKATPAQGAKKVVVTNAKVSKKIVPKKWSDIDKKYAQGGYVKEQSVSIFGGAPLPWTISKPAGVEWDNKRKIELQKGLKRPGTNRPMTEAVRRRVEKEAAEERKKQAKLAAQLKSEGKKGLFGLW